jgi:hypothetical protein
MGFLDYKFTSDLPFISEGYTVLHYDQEPILFTGFNKKGNRIIASSVETNIDEHYELFFHSIIDEQQYISFITKKITYRDILIDVGLIFTIKMPFDQSNVEVFATTFTDIPDKFIPSIDSYCPDLDFQASLEYSMKLEGLDANRHKGDPESVHSISQSFINIINDSFSGLFNSKYQAKVLLDGGGYTKSSFKINFNVELIPTNKILGVPNLFDDNPQEKYVEFIKEYLDYSLNELGSEIDSIFKQNTVSPELDKVITYAKSLTPIGAVNFDEDEFRDNFLNGVKQSANNLNEISKTLGDGFTTISVLNISKDGSEQVLGYIDGGFKQKIDTAMNLVQNKLPPYKDSVPTKYTVYIDHLNVSKRTGNAIITEGDNIWKPKFKIRGTGAINGTIFTESMHHKKLIEVMAIATREAGTREIKDLQIEFK